MVGIRKFDEDRLIEDVMRTFWLKGAEKTTMADLAAAAGVQRGSLYNAYGDKTTLLIAALDRYATRWRERASAALANPDPAQAVAAFLQVHLDRMSDHANPPGCLMTGVCMEQPDPKGHVARHIELQFEKTEEILEDYFHSARKRGKLTAALDPRAGARFVVATSRGMAVMHKAHGGRIDVVEDIMRTAILPFRQRP